MAASSRQRLRSVIFNSDFTCFASCPELGAYIFNTHPLAYLGKIDGDLVGSLSQCRIMGRSNLCALTSGGKTPKFAENTVLMWNDYAHKFEFELAFPHPVLNTLLTNSCLVVILAEQVQVFRFPKKPPDQVCTLKTGRNPRGIGCICDKLLAFPAVSQAGHVQLLSLDNKDASPIIIPAHRSELAALALTTDASLLATASIKGTLIRVFDTYSRRQVLELRRGGDQAQIYSLTFAPTNDYLCATFDKGTVHVWAVRRVELNKTSALRPAAGFLTPYVDSLWALVTFQVSAGVPSVAGFVSNSSVAVVCNDGSYHKYAFTQSGTASRETFDYVLDIVVDSEFG